MNPQIFLEWVRYAIGRVGSGYFGHAERVYCYELYHFIRVAMFHYENTNGRIDNIFLHSELVKTVLTDAEANRYEAYPLDGLRMPDFLFHTPGSFENQIAAIEVKTNDLTYSNLTDDLHKLGQLRVNYRYELVIFHCVNVRLERLLELLARANREQLELDLDILVLCKPSFEEELISQSVGELLQQIA